MELSLNQPRSAEPNDAAVSRWGNLPRRMRVLYVGTAGQTAQWLAEALAADSVAAVTLESTVGSAAALARLREEPFDALLISHRPACLDALEFIEALRGGGAVEPVIVLGAAAEHELASQVYEAGGDGYLCAATTSTRTLIWTLARAVQRQQLLAENGRLAQGERRRLQQEHHEAVRLLDEQRSLLKDLEQLRDRRGVAADPVTAPPASEPIAPQPTNQLPIAQLPPALISHYRELLRTYVIMGSGNLTSEMHGLAELLAQANLSAPAVMQLHLSALEEMVRGLGTRSARHVMSRADLLILEVLVHLTETYRRGTTGAA